MTECTKTQICLTRHIYCICKQWSKSVHPCILREPSLFHHTSNVSVGALRSWLFLECTAKTLIRLGGCTGHFGFCLAVWLDMHNLWWAFCVSDTAHVLIIHLLQSSVIRPQDSDLNHKMRQLEDQLRNIKAANIDWEKKYTWVVCNSNTPHLYSQW